MEHLEAEITLLRLMKQVDGTKVSRNSFRQSRNLGKQVAELYQKLAINLNRGYGEYLEKRDEIIRTYKEQGRKREIQDALKQLHWQVYESPSKHAGGSVLSGRNISGGLSA